MENVTDWMHALYIALPNHGLLNNSPSMETDSILGCYCVNHIILNTVAEIRSHKFQFDFKIQKNKLKPLSIKLIKPGFINIKYKDI